MNFSISSVIILSQQPNRTKKKELKTKKLTEIFLIENLELATEVLPKNNTRGIGDGIGDLCEAIEVRISNPERESFDDAIGEAGVAGHGEGGAAREREREEAVGAWRGGEGEKASSGIGKRSLEREKEGLVVEMVVVREGVGEREHFWRDERERERDSKHTVAQVAECEW